MKLEDWHTSDVSEVLHIKEVSHVKEPLQGNYKTVIVKMKSRDSDVFIGS